MRNFSSFFVLVVIFSAGLNGTTAVAAGMAKGFTQTPSAPVPMNIGETNLNGFAVTFSDSPGYSWNLPEMNAVLDVLADTISNRMTAAQLRQKKWRALTITFSKGLENSVSVRGSRAFLRIPEFFDFKIIFTTNLSREEIGKHIQASLREDILPKVENNELSLNSSAPPTKMNRCSRLLSAIFRN